MRLTALCLVVVACGTPTVLDGKSSAAISMSDKVIYEADRSAAIAACGERIAIGCAACPERRPTCAALPNPISTSMQRFCEL